MIDEWVRLRALRARGTRWLRRRHTLSTVHMLDITATSTYTVSIGRANVHRTWSSTVVTVNWRCIIFICSLCHRWTAAGLVVNFFYTPFPYELKQLFLSVTPENQLTQVFKGKTFAEQVPLKQTVYVSLVMPGVDCFKQCETTRNRKL